MIVLLLTAFYLFGQTLPVTSRSFLVEGRSFTAEQYELYSALLLLALIVILALFPYAHFWKAYPQKGYKLFATAAISGLLVPLLLNMRWSMNRLRMLAFWLVAVMLISWLFAFWQILVNLFRKRLRKPAGWGGQMALILIHIGFAVMAVGILGAENLAFHEEFSISVNETIEVNAYTITLYSIEQKHIAQTDLVFTAGVVENGRQMRMTPALAYFPKRERLHSRPEIHATLLRDVQLVVTRLPEAMDQNAVLRFYVFPLMSWIWAGSAFMVLGSLFRLVSLLGFRCEGMHHVYKDYDYEEQRGGLAKEYCGLIFP